MAEARVSKKDEFYTQIETIEDELKYYDKELENKVVYCNCDDARESNFFLYFLRNFDRLKLKKLIASCYVSQEYNLFSIDDKREKAISVEYTGGLTEKDLSSEFDIYSFESIKITELKGDGDFRSEECIDLLMNSDIVITNPPFSLFKEYINVLESNEKRFLIIGNANAITYRDFFNLIKKNKLWPGVSFNKTIEFEIPDYYEKHDRINELTGKKYASVPAVSWWTNLNHEKEVNEDIPLTESYKDSSEEYPKYSNYNGIDVNKLSKIPKDYNGVMGVPITFIGKYNSDQFEILGLGAGEMYKQLKGDVLGQEFLDKYFECGGKGNYVANQSILGYYDSHGKPVIPYMRILIKNKKLK